MKIAYIDFDGTLFKTSVVKDLLLKEISSEIVNELETDFEKIYASIKEEFKNNHNNSTFYFAKKMAEKYDVSEEKVTDRIKNLLNKGSDFLFDDSIEFIKNLKDNGYEVYILTFSKPSDYEFQMRKLMGSGVNDFVDGFVICSKNKGELNLDYKNGIFIDDNPDQLTSLFNAGVGEDRLFRIKRKNEKYSLDEITGFSPREYDTLENMEI